MQKHASEMTRAEYAQAKADVLKADVPMADRLARNDGNATLALMQRKHPDLVAKHKADLAAQELESLRQDAQRAKAVWLEMREVK